MFMIEMARGSPVVSVRIPAELLDLVDEAIARSAGTRKDGGQGPIARPGLLQARFFHLLRRGCHTPPPGNAHLRPKHDQPASVAATAPTRPAEVRYTCTPPSSRTTSIPNRTRPSSKS